jgi:tetratricopeptide (TPR) repeat protein
MKTALQALMLWALGALGCFNLYAQIDVLKQSRETNDLKLFVVTVDNLTQFLLQNPNNEEAYYNRGDAYFHLRRYTEALKDFNKAVELDPSHSMTYYMRGSVYLALEKYQEALWDLNKSIELYPGNEHYLADRAHTYLMLERYSQANADCKEALKLNPTHAKAMSVRGMIRLAQKNYGEAFEDLQQAIQLAPKESDLYLNLAQYYKTRGQTEKAIESYSAAANLDRNNPAIYHQLAVYKLSLGNDSDAQKDAAQAIYNNPRYFPAYVTRGIAFHNLGDKGRYLYDINKYLQQAIHAEDFAYIARSVLNYSKHREFWEQAENWASKAVQLNSNYENYLLQANLLFKIGKTTLAREAAEKGVAIARKKKSEATDAYTLIARIDRESVDQTPPIIRITSPVASNRGGVVVESTQKITVIGHVSDESGVAKVLINGNPARINPADGNFDGETILKDGNNIIQVQAFDLKGNMATKSFAVEKNVERPGETPLAKLGGKGYALIFATNDYDTWTPLINPVLDGRAIAKDLKEIYGFETELIENMKKDDILLKIKSYARRQYENNDQLFIFFAGHGQFDEVFKEGYVVAKDSKFDEESKSSYISHTNLKTYINNIPCKHISLLLDVCFGGTIDQTVAQRGSKKTIFDKDREEYINRKLRYTTRLYLTSGGKEYVPDGRPGSHSPFARRLLEALRSEGGTDGILTMAEILEYVANLKPEPRTGEFGNNEPGSDFLFIKK